MKKNKQELNNELDEDNDFDKNNSIDEFHPDNVFDDSEEKRDFGNDDDNFLPNIDNDEFITKKE